MPQGLSLAHADLDAPYDTTPAAVQARPCVAIIYLKAGSYTGRWPADLLQATLRLTGVTGAWAAPTRARVMMVRYDARQTSRSLVVEKLRRAGFLALLVGC